MELLVPELEAEEAPEIPIVCGCVPEPGEHGGVVDERSVDRFAWEREEGELVRLVQAVTRRPGR